MSPPDDPRRTAQSILTSLTNNRSRMNSPEYRRQGLSSTSSLMESLVKKIHWRVTGTKKFWPQRNDSGPTGATPILALPAAALSEDDPLEALFASHSHVLHPRGTASQTPTATRPCS